MPRPRVTFSRNGMTSPGASGPPTATGTSAAYMPPTNQPSAIVAAIGLRESEDLLHVPVGVVVVEDRVVEVPAAAGRAVGAQVVGRARDGVVGVHDVGLAVAVAVHA